mmetsp:Transcript_37211/g.88840  ORF Transcript_37211/g.88840 Transcript_37211/m.88840 type:complete len:431 (+) Transcript_37211:53-1345(+)
MARPVVMRGKSQPAQPSRAPQTLPGGAFTHASMPKTAADFEAALARAESGGADALQIWTDYVLWAKRSLPKDHHAILHRACRSVAADKRHAQDIRLLRLWVMLADKEPRPDVFKLLEARNIGTSHALLYEAWAHCLEARRDFDGAAEVYRRGLTSLAAPQARLRARRADFEERMRVRVMRIARDGSGKNATPSRSKPQSLRLSRLRAVRASIAKRPSHLCNLALRTRTPRKEKWPSAAKHQEPAHPPRAASGAPSRARALEPKRQEPAPRTAPTLRAEPAKCTEELPRQPQAVDFQSRKAVQELPEAIPSRAMQVTASAPRESQQQPQQLLKRSREEMESSGQAAKSKEARQTQVTVGHIAMRMPKAASKSAPARGSRFGWLALGGLFRREEDTLLEDCEEESVMEDDELSLDGMSPSPPAKRRLMSWLW